MYVPLFTLLSKIGNCCPNSFTEVTDSGASIPTETSIPPFTTLTPYVPPSFTRRVAFAQTCFTVITSGITFTTTYPHGISSGQTVVVSGVTPAGYNGTWTAQSGTTGSTLVLNIGSNPGAITIAGKIDKKATFVKVLVQVPTNVKTTNTNAKLFESVATSTLPVLDGGSIV